MTAVDFPLLEQTTLTSTDKALIFSASDASLIRALVRRVASLHVYDSSYQQLEKLRASILSGHNSSHNVPTHPPSPKSERGTAGEIGLAVSDDVFPTESLASTFDVAL